MKFQRTDQCRYAHCPCKDRRMRIQGAMYCYKRQYFVLIHLDSLTWRQVIRNDDRRFRSIHLLLTATI